MYFHPLLPLPDYRQEESDQSIVEQHPETGTPPASGSFSVQGFQLERGLHPAVDALLDRITCEGCE